MPELQETSQNQNKNIEEKEEVLFSWEAWSRPFKRRTREFYVTVISIASVLGFVIFLIEGIMPVILLASLVFLFYILNTVEPGKIEYRLTNKGIQIGDKRTPWELVKRYWFSEKLGSEVVVFETSGFPGRLEMVINRDDIGKIKESVKDQVREEKTSPDLIDKTTDWFSSKLPRS